MNRHKTDGQIERETKIDRHTNSTDEWTIYEFYKCNDFYNDRGIMYITNSIFIHNYGITS